MGFEIFFSSDQMSQSWKLIYDEHHFPFDVRYHLTDWFEKISWYDLNSENKANNAEVYQSLHCELDKKIDEPSLDQLIKLQLKTAKKKIQEDFEARPGELVDVLKVCFNSERLLIASTEPDEDRKSTAEDKELLKYREKETKFQEVLTKLKQHSQQLEQCIEEAHNFMPLAVASFKDLVEQYNVTKADATMDLQKKNIEIKKLLTDINQRGQLIKQHAGQLEPNLTVGSQMLSSVLHDHCWALITYYKEQQKHATCYFPKPPEGAVDILNKVCEESSKQLKAYIYYIDRVLADISLLYSGEANGNAIIIQLKTELQLLLEKHLNNIFVITKQPPNVLKIVQNKSPQLSMCVRLLGGRGLGIEYALPCITVRVYKESVLRAAMDVNEPSIEGQCKSVENGNRVMMELKRATGHIQANLNVQMRGVERLERKVKDDRVTEHKYGMVFYTQVNVCNKMCNVKALSLPIVLTSQTSQNGAATGTLVWDAAFSKQDRELYEDEASVPWFRMETVLKAMFNDTGRGLDQDQINYLANYIFKAGPVLQRGEDYSNHILTKEKFLRDKVPGRDFTFWRWIYACKNLIINDVSQEWKDKMIYGFIGKEEAERLLRPYKVGTFLLRFRERKLEESQRALKCACLALAVVGADPVTGATKVGHVKDHLTPTDIHKYSLTRILSSLVDVDTKQVLLTTLYPNTDFAGLIQKYLPDTGEGSAGYTPTQFLIGVMNGKPDGAGSSTYDGSMSPASTPSTTPRWSGSDMMSSPLAYPNTPLSDDLENLHVDPLLPPEILGMSMLSPDGNMLMMGNNMKRIDPQIPISVCELQDQCSIESTTTASQNTSPS